MSRLVFIVVLFLLIGSHPGSAQQDVRYSEDAEKIFLDGLRRFRSNDFEGAYSNFADVLTRHQTSQRVSAAYIMGAKSLLQLERYDDSIQLLGTFLKTYPASRYVPDAQFTLGVDFYITRRYEQAATGLMKVLESSKEKRLLEKAEAFLTSICNEHLDGDELKRLFNTAVSPQTKFLLGLKLAEKRAEVGKLDEGRATLTALIQQYPNSPYAGGVRELLQKFEKKPSVKIGTVLPLFLESKDAGEKEIGAEMLQGIEFAVEESRTSSSVWVDLITMDSEGDARRATSAVRTLSSQKDIVAILGPIYSAEVSASAKTAGDSGVPLITPTANANGLASLGVSIFQANPDYDLRGRGMARYAVRDLGLRSFAVLAPSDSYGKFMAESFLDELRRLAAKVVSVEWYQRGTTDLQDQFVRLRKAARMDAAEPLISFASKVASNELRKLSHHGVPRRLLDSLIARREKVKVGVLLGSEGARIADSLGIPTLKEVPVLDTLENPIKTIQGFYLPIGSSKEIGILSSQLAYYNFKTQVLGGGDWYNPVELDANRRYTDGVIFDSDTYADAADSSYLKFFDSFYQKTGTRPTKNTLLGYDSAKLLLSAIASGAATRQQIASALREVKDFNGLHSKISFTRDRVNSALNVLRYKGGEVKKLDDIIVQDE